MGLEEKLVQKLLENHVEESDKTELVLLRVKLEVRTWFLRASMAFNTSFVAGLVIHLITK